MKKYILLLPLLSLLFFSCEEENLNNIAVNQFVVEAFIYAGEPITDIRIKSTFPLSQEEGTSAPINDAEVSLIKNGQRYALVASGQEGLYSYPKEDLSVNTNDVFQLEVVHNGITATAETRVPTPTEGLRLSEDSLKVPQLPFSEGREVIVEAIGSFLRTSRIEATWLGPSS